MGVKRLSTSSGLLTDTRYRSMLAGYGDFGALQRIGYSILTANGTFDFSNIPQTYQDLRVVCFVRSTNANATGDAFCAFLNHGAGIQYTGYSSTNLSGNGSSAVSNRETSTTAIRIPNFTPTTTQTAGVFASVTMDILNYRSSTYKTVLLRGAGDTNGAGQTTLTTALSQNTGAITGIVIATGLGGNHFAIGSTAELFGVKASNA